MDKEELLEAMLLCENLYNNGGTVLEGDDTFQTIGRCIERQIPKKPKKVTHDFITYYVCPTCNTHEKCKAPYCRWCSQKLDWSE